MPPRPKAFAEEETISPPLTLGQALELHRAGKLDEADQAYAALLSASPLSSDPIHLRGAIALQRGDYAGAAELIRRAILCDPSPAAYYGNLGESERRGGELPLAIHSLRRALILDPQLADARHNLGLSFVHQGNTEDGRTLIQEAIQLSPRPIYFYSLSDIGAVQEPEIAAMTRLAEPDSGLAPPERATLLIALGRALNARGDKDIAFEHILAGNAIRRDLFVYDERAAMDLYDRVSACFNADWLAGTPVGEQRERDPIFVLGMPRSGTSLVEQILSSHSAIYGAGELNLVESLAAHTWPGGFPEELAESNGERWKSFAAAYRAQADAMGAGRRIVDKMPMNFFFIGAIYRAMPSAKIIRLVRDPVDTCLSCFTTLFGVPHPYSYDLGTLGRYYRRHSELMNHWHAILPPGVLLDVDYAALISDQENETRRILAHCELEWEDACLAFYKTKRSVGTASHSQVRQPINRAGVGRWRPSPGQISPLKDALGLPPA